MKLNFVQTLSTGLVKILRLKFRQDFEAGVCSAFMKLNLGRDSKARFGQDFEVDIQARF